MGTSGAPKGEAPVASFNRVSPGFFQTLQTAMLAGRDFDEHDLKGSPNVAIVNEGFARKFANGRNPVGMTFRIGRLRTITPPYEIIGLAKNSKYFALREAPQPIVYTSQAQYDHPDSDAQILIRSRASLTCAKSSRIGVNNPVYVAGFDRGVRPIGLWSTLIALS